MAISEFLGKKEQRFMYEDNMKKLNLIRLVFLQLLREHGSDNGAGEIRVTLAADGDLVQVFTEPVKISSHVTGQEIQSDDPDIIISVELTSNEMMAQYHLPLKVKHSYARVDDVLEGRTNNRGALYCLGLSEVLEYVQSGKLAVVKS